MATMVSMANDLRHIGAEETPSIGALSAALNGFTEALQAERPNYDLIYDKAKETYEALNKILNEPNNNNFKNVSTATKWTTYLAPLRNLQTLLQYYVHPTFATPRPQLARLKQALVPAFAMINGEKGEINYQQGLVARVMSTAANRIKIEGDRLVNSFSGPSVQSVTPTLHPLLQLMELIATYQTQSKDYLPEDWDDQIRLIIKDLDQYGDLFKGVEAYVMKKIGNKPLHKSLRSIMEHITQFALGRSNDVLPLLIYHLVTDSKGVIEEKTEPGMYGWVSEKTGWSTPKKPATPSSDKGKVAIGNQYLDDMKHLTGQEFAAALDLVWKALTQYDEYMQLEALARKLTAVDAPSSLGEKLDLAIEYYEKRENQQLPKAVEQGADALANIMQQWLSFTYTWSSKNLSTMQQGAVKQKLRTTLHMINRGEHLKALKFLKKTLEASPMGPKLYAKEEFSTPINNIDQIVGNLENTPPPAKTEVQADWTDQMDKERRELVQNISYVATFKTVFDKVCGLENGKPSNEVFATLLERTRKQPAENRKSFFIDLLQEKIEERTDLDFFTKFIAKMLAWFVFTATEFFSEPFTASLLDHFTGNLMLTSKQPLGTSHLSPIQKVNECLVAHTKALTNWQKDNNDGKSFGAVGRTEALKTALSAPSLNHGFEVSKVTNKFGKIIVDKFLHVNGFTENISIWQKGLIEWANAPSEEGLTVVLQGMKWCLVLLPLITITTVHVALTILEWVGGLILRTLTKYLISKYELVNNIVNSTSDSIYKQSQFTHAIDEVVLSQLLAVEKLLEVGGEAGSVKEGEGAKRLFKELVENFFEVVDKRQHLTPEKMAKAAALGENILHLLPEEIKGRVDGILIGAVLNLLLVGYGSILTEKQMQGLLLQILQKANFSFKPQSEVFNLFSAEEQQDLAKRLGKEVNVLTEDDIKLEFGRKNPNTDIPTALKNKYKRTEEAIKESLNRIITKSVHDVVQNSAKTILISGEEAIFEFADWLKNSLLQEDHSFLSLFEEKLVAYKKTKDPEIKKEKLREMHAAFSSFMKKYHQKQKLLDEKNSGKGNADIRSLNHLSNTLILPGLTAMNTYISTLIQTGDPEAVKDFEKFITKFKKDLSRHTSQVEKMKKTAIASNKKTFVGQAIELGAPSALAGVEAYVNNRLTSVAAEGILMYKDATVFESFLRHVVMLNFVESEG